MILLKNGSVTVAKSILILLLLSDACIAQNIEARLSGSDSSKAFHIINDGGDTLFTIRGDGSVNFSNKLQINSQNYLLNVNGTRTVPPGGDGRDVLIHSGSDIILNAAEASHGMTEGGQIKIHSGDSPDRGDIEIKGGDDNETGAGEISINAGAGNDLNLFAGSNSLNYFGGDINIESGSAGIGGDVNINAGEGVSDAGDINLTPGTTISDRGGGLVNVIGSGTVSGSWTVAADERFKKNIENLGESIGEVLKLRSVKFELKSEEFPERNFENGERIGLIAQEVEVILPQLIKTDKDGYKSIDYSKLSVLLIQAIKEQQKEIEEIKKLLVK